MALFKKPNRKQRQQRLAHSDSEEDQEHTSLLRTQEDRKNKDKDDRVKTTSTLLSFGEAEEDADEGEVFKVRKSSYSRRIAKELEKERRRKKCEDSEPPVKIEESTAVKRENEGNSTKTVDLPLADGIDGIRIKNSIKILNSDEIERLDDVKVEDDDEDDHNDVNQRIEFNRDSVSRALEKGAIPDAATIFALKKQRQKMAGRSGEDFISLKENKETNGSSARAREGRLQEDEDDSGAEDGRVNFSDIRSGRREEIREVLGSQSNHSVEHENEDDEDTEALRWEKEQIRKGVGTLAGAQTFSRSPSPNPEDRNRVSNLPPVYIPTDKSGLTIKSVVDRVRDRLSNVKDIVARSQNQYTTIATELALCAETIQSLEKQLPRTEKEYRFYQEIQTYSIDLIECLDAKVPIINALEGRLLSALAQRSEKFVRRRRQDVKDQAEEVRPGAIVETAAKRRAREREGRRMRRKTARQTSGVSRHFDGMSSDDEQIETERLQLSTDREQVLSDATHIFEDVNDDFSKLSSVLKQFEKWKLFLNESYQEAYIPVCVLKLVLPFVRLEMLNWNPLETSESVEKYQWFKELLFFGYKIEDKDESDLNLIPRVVERALIPKISDYAERVWDPMSTSQTRNLVRCIRKLCDDYPFGRKSKPLATLLGKIFVKIQRSLEEDVFVPMATKEVVDNPFCPSSLFFQRQFWSAVKLLENILSFHGILAEQPLKEVAIMCLLNRYLLFALQCSLAHKDTVDRVEAIGAMLPTAWLRSNPPAELQMFSKLLLSLIKHLKSTFAPDLKIQSIIKLHDSCSAVSYADLTARKK
ncbi:PAX3- and PAX7-binding protein 1 [Galendromus occidentalis]|uniref:PAX3- and PAX7-binding protein 1 n=1 Tax=Galendromus occidentalis TaxID=34638 RepID=A0AAJ7WHM0_9ACAR|nr:PAX3- and PAX7-binding protein 1 [Galendromus occidentalis]